MAGTRIFRQLLIAEFKITQEGFGGISSLLLRSSFALPSLQSRDENTGFSETAIKQTYLFAACGAGYKEEAEQYLCGDGGGVATLMQGWSEEGTALVRGRCGDG